MQTYIYVVPGNKHTSILLATPRVKNTLGYTQLFNLCCAAKAARLVHCISDIIYMKQVYSTSHSLDTLFMDNNSPMQWSIKMKFARLGSSLQICTNAFQKLLH